MSLFNRQAAFLFGKRGDEFVRLDGLRITFKINRTSESVPSEGKVSIYNLSKSTRAKLEKEEDLTMILEVGYENDIAQIFIADTVKVSSKKKGTDIITTIEAGDGDKATTTATINKSYDAGIDLKSVVKDVAESMKEVAGTVVDTVKDVASKINQNGLTISGASKEIMTQVLGRINPDLEWSIQSNELQITKELETTGEDAVLLTPQTGLIGIPSKSVKKDKEGMVIRSLIMANDLKPGRALKLESETESGVFKIREVEYIGDTHGNSWFATILGQGIE